MITVTLDDGAGKVISVQGDLVEVEDQLDELGWALNEIVEQVRNPERLVPTSGRGELPPPTNRLRTPPAPTAVQDEGDGPRCQECRKIISPLTQEDALELYGLVVCTRCGKDME